MLGRRDQPLPVEAVRDLLGLVRGVYRAEQTADDVATALGVTRTRAWHAIKELRRNGRVLDLAPGLYRAAAKRPAPVRRERARRVNVRLEERAHARLVALAEQRGETVSETVSAALQYLLDVPTDVVRLDPR